MQLGQNEEVASIAGDMVRYWAPGMWAVIQFEAMRAFLMAQGVFKPAMYVQIMTIVLHVGWCFLFIYHMRLGAVGAGIALSITNLCSE